MNCLNEQYAFRPTGSTTAALVALLHHITEMLKTHNYVAIIGTDYTKAFDTVRHYTLAQILNNLHLPDNIYNWFVNYYTKRGHVTRFQGVISSVAYINASVVQGSVVGPASFVTCASTLQPKHRMNIQVKYADDAYLLIGSKNIHTAEEEMNNISIWAQQNNLRLKSSKTREMIVSRRGNEGMTVPAIVVVAIRVEAMKILGVTLTSDLKIEEHLNKVLSSAASSISEVTALQARHSRRSRQQQLWPRSCTLHRPGGAIQEQTIKRN